MMKRGVETMRAQGAGVSRIHRILLCFLMQVLPVSTSFGTLARKKSMEDMSRRCVDDCLAVASLLLCMRMC
jgi:hypothetical protein